VCDVTLTAIPEGAPAFEGMACEGGDIGGGTSE